MEPASAQPSMSVAGAGADRVQIERWPTEIALLVLLIFAAIGIWVVLFVSIIGVIYALLLMVFFFLSQLMFVAHIRGNGIRLNATQFPELHGRLEELAARAGLKRTPEAYIIQAGGVLNAMATKFLRSRMMIIYSDLLEACGDDESARDMIIGHELGHIAAGHLNWMWFLLPGYVVPFLGTAYSRAREYTCDRYGAALARDRSGALHGLAVLAAGGKYSGQVNLQSLVEQRQDMNTGWMTIGRWLMTHPPLCDRVAALDPMLSPSTSRLAQGPARALVILAALMLVPVAGLVVGAAKFWPLLKAGMEQSQRQAAQTGAVPPNVKIQEWKRTVNEDFQGLAAVIDESYRLTGALPENNEALAAVWKNLRPNLAEPIDPFDGTPYGYHRTEDGYELWSSGPDAQVDTADDMVYSGRIRAAK